MFGTFHKDTDHYAYVMNSFSRWLCMLKFNNCGRVMYQKRNCKFMKFKYSKQAGTKISTFCKLEDSLPISMTPTFRISLEIFNNITFYFFIFPIFTRLVCPVVQLVITSNMQANSDSPTRLAWGK